MALTNSNIQNMMGSIINSGVAFANRYEVLVTPPPQLAPVVQLGPAANSLSGAFQQVMNMNMLYSMVPQINIRCETVTIPGRALATTSYRIYGPARQMPTEAIYSGEIGLTIILSEDMRERQLFDSWMNLISNRIDYKLAYYNEYTTNIQINMLNREDQITHSVILEETYPKSLGDIQVGYSRENEILRQEVTMAFRRYTPVYSYPLLRPV